MLKNKRILLIVLAVVFLVLIFFLKTKSQYKNEIGDQIGLAYGEQKVESLATKDSDKDGVPDWEEGLWGTDPNKKDTNDDGVPDSVAVENLKSQTNSQAGVIQSTEDENLTETDKFSRQLFNTVATLNQAGPVDENTIDKLGTALSEELSTPKIRKVFLASEAKVSTKNDSASFKKYSSSLDSIFKKYPSEIRVLDILQEFLNSGETPDVTTLNKLDPLIESTTKTITEMAKMEIPSSLLAAHLNLLNSLEQNIENLEDLQMFDTDSIVAMNAMSQYEKNSATLQDSIQNLNEILSEKLSN